MTIQTVPTVAEIGIELSEVILNDIRNEISRIASNGDDFVTNSQLSALISMLQNVRNTARNF